MKPSRFNRFFVLTTCAAAAYGNAATLTWDSDATFANGSTDGSGTWDTSTANWNNGTVDITWPNLVADTAVFGAGGTPGTVAVSGTVNVGRLTFNTPGSGAYTLSGGTLNGLSAISNLNTNGSITTIGSDITRTGNLSIYGGGATCNLTLSGAVNLGGSGNLTIPARNSTDTANASNTNGTIRLSGATSNTMGLNITSTKTGSQGFASTVTVVLAKTGGAQAVSGNVSIGVGNGISRGIVQLGGSDQIADTATVALGGSGYAGNTRFQLMNFNETIAGLSSSSNAFPGGAAGTTAVENGSASAGTSTLTISGSGTYTYGTTGATTTLRDGSTGKLALTMNGVGGTQIVTIGATYTGATTVTAGTLSIRSTFSSSATTVNGGTLNFQTATVGAAISGSSGQVTISGGTNTNFSGGNKTYSVDTVLSGASTILTQTAANSLSASSLHSIGTGAMLRTGNLAGSVKALTGVGSVDLNGASANLTIADGAGQDFGGIIGGTGALTKSGSGTQTLSGANNYTGASSVKNGSLVLSGGNNRIATTGSLTLGDISTAGKLVLGNSSAASNQTLAGLTTTGSGGSVVGAHASADSVLTLNIAGTNTYGGTLGGAGTHENKLALTKAGAGLLTLNAANTYTGTTTVQQGTLALGSAGTISSTLVLGVSGGTVGTLDVTSKASSYTQANVSGNGTLNIGTGKTINVTTALAPGFSPGTLNVTGSLALAGSTLTTIELAGDLGVAGTDFDFVNVSETLTLNGTLNIISYGGYDLAQVGTYNLFDATSFTGDFESVSVGGLALSFSSDLWSASSGGYHYSFNETNGVLTVVPEPKAALLGGIGLLCLLRRRRA